VSQLSEEETVTQLLMLDKVETTVLPRKKRCDSWESTDSGLEVLQHMDPEDKEDDFELVDHESGLRILSLEDVSYHCQPHDAWMVVYDRIYDVTEYLRRHPGGEEVMLEYVGYDATMAFRGVGHSAAATRAMAKFLIGILPKHERLGFSAD
jgi:cytochrome b involved in lipid metabolism